ncbi:MAG: adenylate/guanylate cyclase domain-containing protein [Candidatus Cloacimonetes bacterium]|nr:adenylate/guanylate cyclase domain-containing protein [Candidatus Cloacimonadota bacterium]
MRINYILAITLFSFAVLFAQSIENLKAKLEKASANDKPALLNQISAQYFSVDLNTAKEYAELALSQSEANDDQLQIAESYKNLAGAYYLAGIFDKSLEYYNHSLKIAQIVNDKILESKLLYNIGHVHLNLGNYSDAFLNYEKSFEIKRKFTDDPKEYALSYSSLGMLKSKISDHESAIEYYLLAIENFMKSDGDNSKNIAYNYNNIGTIYERINLYDKALEYYEEALAIFSEKEMIREEGSALTNIGVLYLNKKDFENAKKYLLRSTKIKEDTKDMQGLSIAVQNLGTVHLFLNDYKKAIEYLNKSLDLEVSMNSVYGQASVLSTIGQAYLKNKQYKKAEEFLQNSKKLAETIDAKDILVEVEHFLANLYKDLNKSNLAYEALSRYASLKDTIFSIHSAQKISDLQNQNMIKEKIIENEILKKEDELKTLEISKQKNYIFLTLIMLAAAVIVAITLFIFLSLRRNTLKKLNEAHAQISAQKNKADQLLKNVLPQNVIDELNQYGESKPKYFENMAVLIADIVDFTFKSAELHPEKLIDELNDIFSAFDRIILKNGCERIKTIGDAYMAVSGIEKKTEDMIERLLVSANQFIEYLETRNQEKGIIWKIRVGVHTGPVIGGIVGKQKYIYDVFGDTINMTTRLMQLSEPMKINVSEKVYSMANSNFEFTKRGEIDVKGKGKSAMFFLDL